MKKNIKIFNILNKINLFLHLKKKFYFKEKKNFLIFIRNKKLLNKKE